MKKLIAGIAIVASGLGLTGCSQKYQEPYRDSHVSTHVNNPAEIHSNADGFSNYSEQCDGHGFRVFVLYHQDSPYGSISTQPDPKCGG